MSLYLIFFYLFSLSNGLTTCPKQCICQEHSIACSCEGAQKPELIISSLGSTYITSLIVHTCDKVTILNGSFAGVILVERLSFIAIDRLYFEPHAFKDILQSPRQIVIDECTIPSLAPVAFAGLSHIDHLWFRNSKIDIISMEAFHFLTNIDYIYFHKTKIGRIERKAFSKMYQINHFYFKQSIKIDKIESEAFSESQIDELMFDDVTIVEAQDTFMINTKTESVIIQNSTIHLIPKNFSAPFVFDDSGQKITKKCRIENSEFNSFSPVTFGCVSTNVSESKIDKIGILSSDNQIVEPYKNINYKINILTFSNCTIGSIISFGLSNYSLNKLSISQSKIAKIEQKSISMAKIDSLIIENSIIDELQSFSFEKSIIRHLKFVSMSIKMIRKEVFYNCSLEKFEVFNSKIEKIFESIFKKSIIRSIHFDGSRIDNFDSMTFYGKNKIDSISLTGNDLSTQKSISFLSSHPFEHPIRFIFANNTIDCSTTHCSINSFLLNSPKHSPLEWQIANNKCRPPIDSPCVSPRIVTIDNYGITCRISWQVAECTCTRSDAQLPFGYQLFGGDVSVVIIGDCERLLIGQPVIELPQIIENSEEKTKNRVLSHAFRGHSQLSTITQIYIFRTTKCDLNQLPQSIKVLKIFHSTISIVGRMGRQPITNPQIWHFAHSSIDQIEEFGLVDVHLKNFTIIDSRLTRIPPIFNSKIDHLIIDSSLLVTTKSLFQITDKLRMSNSMVFSTPRGLGSISSAQLQNNTLLECCGGSAGGSGVAEIDERCDSRFYGVQCWNEIDEQMPNHLPIKFSQKIQFSGSFFSLFLSFFFYF